MTQDLPRPTVNLTAATHTEAHRPNRRGLILALVVLALVGAGVAWQLAIFPAFKSKIVAAAALPATCGIGMSSSSMVQAFSRDTTN